MRTTKKAKLIFLKANTGHMATTSGWLKCGPAASEGNVASGWLKCGPSADTKEKADFAK